MIGYKIPYGFKDVVKEANLKLEIQNKLLDTYMKRGYQYIETPTVEYLSSLGVDEQIIDSKKLFKFTDTDGDILALRPDMTTGIARVIGSRFNDSSIKRFSYSAHSFAFKGNQNNLREFTQAGVEIFNSKGEKTDSEVIALAISSILEFGINDIVIDIGHMGIFNGYMQDVKLLDNVKKEISELISKKDLVRLWALVKRENLNEDDSNFLLTLPKCFGEKALVRLQSLKLNKKAKAALDELITVFNYLSAIGFSKYITIDVASVNAFNYYTGIVFKGLSKKKGLGILSGGRYDNLTSSLGSRKCEAIGFAVGVDRLVDILKDELDLQNINKLDIAVGIDKKLPFEKGYAFIEELVRVSGKKVYNTMISNLDDFKNNAKQLVCANEYIFLTNEEGVIKC